MKQRIRNLKISTPSQLTPPSTPHTPTTSATPQERIILLTKYNFNAMNNEELSIQLNEPLMLMNRLGNGWLLVKCINRIGMGLVPASYVGLLSGGVDESWLYFDGGADITDDDRKDSTSSNETRINSSDSNEGKTTVSTRINSSSSNEGKTAATATENVEISPKSNPISKDAPVSCSISNSLSINGRYWYRVDVLLKSGNKRYLSKFYQDFYKLHLHLLSYNENLNNLNNLNNSTTGVLTGTPLPKLPGPIPRPDPSKTTQIILKRCNDLHIYINKLILSIPDHPVLLNWLSVTRENDFEVTKDEWMGLGNDEINYRVRPDEVGESVNNIMCPVLPVLSGSSGSLNGNTNINSRSVSNGGSNNSSSNGNLPGFNGGSSVNLSGLNGTSVNSNINSRSMSNGGSNKSSVGSSVNLSGLNTNGGSSINLNGLNGNTNVNNNSRSISNNSPKTSPQNKEISYKGKLSIDLSEDPPKPSNFSPTQPLFQHYQLNTRKNSQPQPQVQQQRKNSTPNISPITTSTTPRKSPITSPIINIRNNTKKKSLTTHHEIPTIKLKFHYKESLYAVKLAHDVEFEELCNVLLLKINDGAKESVDVYGDCDMVNRIDGGNFRGVVGGRDKFYLWVC